MTKYRLKPADELARVLDDTDHLFLVACNRCFREFEIADAPELDGFLELANAKGKLVTGIARVDFLCNKIQTGKALEGLIPAGTESIFVLGCGLGIQTVARLTEQPVYAATDSLPGSENQGMALTGVGCDACAQCYLNETGGICPVVDCAKSLINGPCGGAKGGMCEINPQMPCAWENIYQRLERQGRLEEFTARPVQIRDYGKVDYHVVSNYVKAIRKKRFAGYYGGVYPTENKESTQDMPVVRFPEPRTVAVNLAQHAGVPARCIVNVGDMVKVGQKIGEIAGLVSANVHSSVSGTVIAIEERPHATRGGMSLAVVIENDKQNTLHESVYPRKPLEELTPEEIFRIIREAGIVGMGGAGFPTYVKLNPGRPVDTVLLNGCECEPYLTADHRCMMEYADQVVFGLRTMCKAVGAKTGIIAIEDNKPDAIALLRDKLADGGDLEVRPVKTKYPQGAEKMLIKRVLDRQVPSGGVPADIGCVVGNVATAKAIADAIQTGMPLVERVVTVAGPRVKNPGNFLVKIGTSIQELLEYCGVTDGEGGTIKIGGSMMGAVQPGPDVPTTKCSNGVLVVDADRAQPGQCIQCGRCVDVCPMELKPLYFAKLVEDPAALKQRDILDCIECGCCDFVCPSRIPLTRLIRSGKNAVRERK